MYSIDGFLFTGTRAFHQPQRIDFWYSDLRAAVYLPDTERPIVLDEEETRFVRRWNELATQSAIAGVESVLVFQRCDRIEQLRRARKLNRVRARK